LTDDEDGHNAQQTQERMGKKMGFPLGRIDNRRHSNLQLVKNDAVESPIETFGVVVGGKWRPKSCAGSKSICDVSWGL
jgi:hypothetical protein